MEDDDEFGDLYTDVLTTFSSSSSYALSVQTIPPPASVNHPIDVKLPPGDAGTVYSSSISKSASSFQDQAPIELGPGIIHFDGYRPSSKAVGEVEDQHGLERKELANVSDSNCVDSRKEGIGSRVLGGGDVNLHLEGDVEGFPDGKGGKFGLEEENFGIEEEQVGEEGIARGVMEDLDSQLVIPGLGTSPSIQGTSEKSRGNPEQGNLIRGSDASVAEGDDWDSDSEDDLQIVLNDNNHGAIGVEGDNRLVGSDDEDDGELIIVADNVAAHPPTEEQEWGEDAGQVADGERKEAADAGKANGAVAVAPKVGYSSFGYHPYHSQFKYVRPGAAPLPGGPPIGSGGPPSQVRPPMNATAIAGRGRGDWRPSGLKGAPNMQKGFHGGFWGNNMSGRGFGGGLEFTLPSHKTIFEVDIDGFEDKPWKYPGVDMSDFFNFGLNEESWKEYCKQLEQLRLESTMQSRIRVYESGRTEQDYDPDLPPELAAAAGQDPSAENANSSKLDGVQNDAAKGTARLRPPLPVGRAIQVEGGGGERLPSVDTRPPRYRDSDAIIEIILQDSTEDDSSTGNGAPEQTDSGNPKENKKAGIIEEDGVQEGSKRFDEYPHAHHRKKGDDGIETSPTRNALNDEIPEEERNTPLLPESPVEYRAGSRGRTPVYSAEDDGTSYEDRKRQATGKTRENSPESTCNAGADAKSRDGPLEESIETVERKHTPESFSPAPSKGRSFDDKIGSDDEFVPVDRKVDREKEEINSTRVALDDVSVDKSKLHSVRKPKLSSRVEPLSVKGNDEGADFKTGRSSENSKATVSSRDHEKGSDGVDEEVVQVGRSTHPGDLKRHRSEDSHGLLRKDRDGRVEADRSYMLAKRREDPYSHREWDPYAAHHFHGKAEVLDRRKERDYSDGTRQWRDDDQHSRRVRAEDPRRHERVDEMVSRQREKTREGERSDKDEHHPRKPLENGSWRGYEKDVRHREKDDSSKSRYETTDDHHHKRRKDDDHVRKDHVDKEEVLKAHRETSGRRKRERDEILDQRKRDDQPRRDSTDDHHSVRHKDEAWSQRDRAERNRERDEWSRSKQSYEESISRRERDDGRGSIRIGRNPEEKAWAGHSRVKDEYKGYDKDSRYKDAGRHSELLKRKERLEEEGNMQLRANEDVYSRGSQFSGEEKRSRQERPSTRNDHSVHASDSQRINDKKHKDNSRRVKESDGGQHNSSGASRKYQEERTSVNEMAGSRGTAELGNERREDVSSDDEQQGSKRGRSKLERWTSHKERTFLANAKSSSSLKVKEIDRDNGGGSGIAAKVSEEPSRKIEGVVDNSHNSVTDGKEVGAESKDARSEHTGDQHLDTVAKLKKRSERFKLPMPSEKDALAVKRLESEPLPSQSKAPANSEVKPERPARKRRWISS